MRTLCASTLIGEFFVIGFAGLVAMKQPELTAGTVWTVSGIAMALCVLLCGMLGRRGGLAVGWLLQAGLIERLRRPGDVLPRRGLRRPVVGRRPLRPEGRRGQGGTGRAAGLIARVVPRAEGVPWVVGITGNVVVPAPRT